MSLELFQHRLTKSQLAPRDIQWMPHWIREFIQFHPPTGSFLDFDRQLVESFLRYLRDRQVPAWQRLQAARVLEWYQLLVLDSTKVDFTFSKSKLTERADLEKSIPTPISNSLGNMFSQRQGCRLTREAVK